MSRAIVIAAAVAAILTPTIAMTRAPVNPRPVAIGGVAAVDACETIAKVTADRIGDRLIPVFAAPDGRARQVDRLAAGAQVYVCDGAGTDPGKWTGIVYEPGRGWSKRCGVARSVAKRRAYRGPCSSGWVSARRLKIIAG